MSSQPEKLEVITGDECDSVLYLAQSLIQIKADSKSARKVDLGLFPLRSSADSFSHHIRECITVNVLIVTKKMSPRANGPFWAVYLIQHLYIYKMI